MRVGPQRRAQMGVPDVWLCFAPLKKDAVDFLVEKATELGVAAFQPVITQHTSATRLNLERLAANAIEAAEQTERLTLPEIRQPLSLRDMIAAWDPRRRIILCAEAGPAAPPRILRADTAALTALAVFQSILGDGALRPPAPLVPIGQLPA